MVKWTNGLARSSLFTPREILEAAHLHLHQVVKVDVFFGGAHRPTAQPPAGAKTTQLHAGHWNARWKMVYL